MWFINENRPIPNNRYFVFVSDTSSLVTATATALQKRIGFDYKNMSDTNAGFIGNGTTFLTLLQNANILDTDARLRVTDIVVLGGNNDRQKGVANVLSAMETFSNYCKQHYPLAKVWVGMTGWADSGLDSSGYVNVGIQFKDVVEYYSHCGAYGMCFMNNVQYATHKTNFWTDTFTLTSDGANWIGGYVADCLLNGSTTVYEVSQATVTYRSGCSAIDNTKIYTSINNNVASLYIRNGSSNYVGFNIPNMLASPRTWHEPVPVCDLANSWCTGRFNEYPYSMASEWKPVFRYNATQYSEECRVMLKGRTLYVQARNVDTTSGNFSLARFREPILITCDSLYC